MPTLAANASITVVVPAGWTLFVSGGAGTATGGVVTDPAGSTLGPFATERSITLTSVTPQSWSLARERADGGWDISAADVAAPGVDVLRRAEGGFNVVGPDGRRYTRGGDTLVPGAVPGDGVSVAPVLSVFDAPSGSGLLNGKSTTSGAPWFVTGAGVGTTSVNPAGYIEGSGNTYCYVQAPAAVTRVEQIFSGPLCTIAIAANNDLQSLIHQNFNSGGVPSMTVFTAGVSAPALWGRTVANIPNINDGQPHVLTLEMVGPLAFAYCDGLLVGVSGDPKFLTNGGNWAYAQIHSSAGDRIYGFRVFVGSPAVTDDGKEVIDVVGVNSVAVASRTLLIGNPSSAGFLPTGSNYFHVDDNSGHNFGSGTETRLNVRSTVSGNRAIVNIQAATTNTILGLRSNADGSADIQHQGANRIVFPFNVARVDQSVPQRLPAYTVATLPSAATFVGCLIRVTDGSANQQLAISDGTAWRFADGTVVS